MWATLAIVAAFLTSFLPIINKRLLSDTDVSVVAWGINALSLPILGAATLAVVGLSQVDVIFLLSVVTSAALNVIATLLSTQSLKLGEASVVTPLLTFNPVFTLIVGVPLLRERPSIHGAIGVSLIVLGAYMFHIEQVGSGLVAPARALVREPGAALAVLASFVWAITPIAEKVAIQHTHPTNAPLVAFASTLGLVCLLSPGLLGRNTRVQVARHVKGFGLAACIAGIAPVAGFTAIGLGLVGYVTALFKLSAIFTVLWSWLFLDESGLVQRLPASAMMVVGAWWITS